MVVNGTIATFRSAIHESRRTYEKRTASGANPAVTAIGTTSAYTGQQDHRDVRPQALQVDGRAALKQQRGEYDEQDDLLGEADRVGHPDRRRAEADDEQRDRVRDVRGPCEGDADRRRGQQDGDEFDEHGFEDARHRLIHCEVSYRHHGHGCRGE